MGCAERVVVTLGAAGKAIEPAALPNRADVLPPAGENLVRIGLVAHIPDEPVSRRIECVVKRYGEFDHPHPAAEVSARLGGRSDDLCSQFGCQTGKIVGAKLAQGPWVRYLVKKRCQPVHTTKCNTRLTRRQAMNDWFWRTSGTVATLRLQFSCQARAAWRERL